MKAHYTLVRVEIRGVTFVTFGIAGMMERLFVQSQTFFLDKFLEHLLISKNKTDTFFLLQPGARRLCNFSIR